GLRARSGSDPATGGFARTARSHILPNFADTRARISRQAIAQGRPECFRRTCLLVCAFSKHQMHTRPRVQRAPGLPRALLLEEGANEIGNLGRNHVARTRIYASSSLRGAKRRSNPVLHMLPWIASLRSQ